MIRARALVGLTVLALLGATACGGSEKDIPPAGPPATAPESAGEESTAAQPTLPQACELVSKEDAEKLARTPLDDAVPIQDTCGYTGPVTGPTAQVEVYVGDGAKKMLDIDRELQHEFTTLPGVGDEAHLEDGAVFFRKGAVWVAIRLVLLNDPAENRGPLEAAARTAASRM